MFFAERVGERARRAERGAARWATGLTFAAGSASARVGGPPAGPGIYSAPLDPSRRSPSLPSPRPPMTLLVDRSTPVPGASPAQRFEAFSGAVGGGDLLAFVGAGEVDSLGVYALRLDAGAAHLRNDSRATRAIRAVADRRTAVPGAAAGATFSAFPFAPTVASGRVAFFATVEPPHSEHSGIYTWSAEDDHLRRVASLGSAGLVYMGLRSGGFDGECVAFYGSTKAEDCLFLVAAPAPPRSPAAPAGAPDPSFQD